MDQITPIPIPPPSQAPAISNGLSPTKLWWGVVVTLTLLVGVVGLFVLNDRYHFWQGRSYIKQPSITGNCPADGFFTDLTKAKAHPDRVCYLYLSDTEFTVIPSEVFSFVNLHELYLRNGKLKSIPKEIALLKQLVTLSLYNNDLSVLPESIGQLPELRRLVLSSNKLTKIPDSLTSLTNLTTLFLNDNILSSLPGNLENMKILGYLDLSHNALSQSEKSRIQAQLPHARIIL